MPIAFPSLWSRVVSHVLSIVSGWSNGALSDKLQESGVSGLHSAENLAMRAWGQALPSGSPAYFDGNAVFRPQPASSRQ
jgi:hypothetical protein